MTQVSAQAKNLRISAKKVRLVASLYRGKKAQPSIESLRFTPKKAGGLLSKVLKSALANATNNANLPADKLVIKEINVGEGPTLKRFRAASRGAAHRILKRTSTIKIVLEDETQDGSKSKS